MFEYFSRSLGIPTALVRLNYALPTCDMEYWSTWRRQVWAGQPVDLAMGHFNTIWQGDANAMTLQSFDRAASPAWIVNVTGPELLSVRAVCEQFGQAMNKPVKFVGTESETALLSNAGCAVENFGTPRVGAERLAEWVDRVGNAGR